jgi:hypothetical protein
MTDSENKTLRFLRDISKQLDRHDYQEVKPWLVDCVKALPIPLLLNDKFPILNKGGVYRNTNELYRAQENYTSIPERATMNLPWKTVDRLSHAPLDKEVEYIKEAGRCNLPGQARFYCSNHYPTACIECLTNGFIKDTHQSKTVTMGTWVVNEPLVLAQVVFSKKKINDIKHFNPELYDDRIKFTESWYEHTLAELEKDVNRPCSMDYAKEILEFFYDEFGKMDIKSERDYILSNFYCDYIFNQVFLDEPKTIDGIIFPSVKYSYQEFNIVIHPRAMSKISFANASQVWVTYDGQINNVQFSPLETSFNDGNGNLKWNLFKY